MKIGDVCEKHNEFSESGGCRWCEPTASTSMARSTLIMSDWATKTPARWIEPAAGEVSLLRDDGWGVYLPIDLSKLVTK